MSKSGAAAAAADASAMASEGLQSAARGLGDAARSAVDASSSLADSASASASSAFAVGSMFGSLNTVFARLAFLFLLLIAFYLLGSAGVALLGWWTRPDRNPVLISGRLSGRSEVTISQDPKKTSAVLVSRSNDGSSGAEFSWAVWLFLDPPAVDAGGGRDPAAYGTVFVKGSGAPDAKTQVNSSNGPGMYVRTDAATGATELGVAMDTMANAVPDWIRVPNMPLRKWVHVVVRLKNMRLQVYVNAAVAASHTLSAFARQNYYAVHVCPNLGFPGELADLRYFDHAVSALRLRALLSTGPNTAASTAATDASKAGGSYTYLSDHWYR
jgi:hypothetical protein